MFALQYQHSPHCQDRRAYGRRWLGAAVLNAASFS